MAKLWIGVDIGKTHHHVAAVDGDGRLVYSRRVANDETALLTVMAEVSTHGRPVCWAVDVTTGLSALLLTLLWRRQVQVRYVSGTVAFHMAAAFAGENKTDARDAVVIAQTIRMRPDIPILEPSDRLLAELTVLTGYRADLVGQRVATLFRLQELLTGISPALERAVDLNRKGPMMVLACWQTPAAIRHAGVDRITALLRRGHVKNAVQVAEAMVAAARQQTVTLPGQRAAAVVVGQMATEILALEQRIAAVDLIADQLDQHPLAPIIGSLPGMGSLLTAELLVHTAGMTEYDSPAKLAAHAGLAPVSRDSGTVSGNHRQPRRYHRRLRHILWMAAFTAARECPASRAYYEKKRAEGKNHRQAILALARRRVDVLWALVRDRKTFTRPAPAIRAAA
ncbi:IS110 family transposase [Micromonospora sp. NPDC050200]|uniref:IS110 family transposase n=1 Tax=Micromonospora sp. NPDC050200 TaxID=3155664 RepID=UPI0033FB6353